MDIYYNHSCGFHLWRKKIPELAKTFGKAKGEYKKGEIEADEELKKFKEQKD